MSSCISKGVVEKQISHPSSEYLSGSGHKRVSEIALIVLQESFV